MAIKVKDDNYYTQQGNKAVKSARNTALKDNTTLYTGQTDSTNKVYDTQVFEENRAYEDQYRENAVQKAINERQVAESMANLGLRDSGLNRTQQTAVQLSYANNNASIDRQKQGAVDSIELARAQALAGIEQNKLTSEAEINQYYDGLAQQYATDYKNADIEAYNKQLEEQTKQQKNYLSYLENQNKQNEKNSYIIKTNGSNLFDGMQGTLKDNKITITAIVKDGFTTGYKYVDNNSGKATTFSVGVNPFTGTNNADTTLNTDTTKAFAKYQAFENGYQPKGIYYNGKDYGWVSHSGIQDYINGNLQNVHKTPDGSLWIWDRAQNQYRPYEE